MTDTSAGALGWSVRLAIGAESFDPDAGLDHTLAKAVLVRMSPVLRYAEDADTWVVRGPERWETAGKDYAVTAVAELASLMPHGDSSAEKGRPERNQAERRARFMTKGSADSIAGQMRALVRASVGRDLRVRLSELDSQPEVLWAGGKPWDLSYEAPTLADLDPATPHLHSAAVAPEIRSTPLWDALLAAVWPDPALRVWAARVLSVAVTGYPDAALPILVGRGGRGKSSVLDLLMSVLGTYADAVSPKLLSGADGHQSIVYALRGLRLAFIDEGPRGGHVATEQLKQLTGGTTLTGNRMRENPVTFRPTHTLALTANDEPHLVDEALRRRVRLIPCDGDPEAVRAAREAIGDLSGPAWRVEMPGVLAAMMREAAEWLSDRGSASLEAAPATVRELADEIGREQDPVRQWLDDETLADANGTRSGALYEAFVEWSKRNAVRQLPTAHAWGRRLNALGYPRWDRGGRKFRPLRMAPVSYTATGRGLHAVPSTDAG